ncbi:MAG: hypothetical protein RI894_695 [Bacteroidota bacterium]|jgi:putative membrane protein
MISYNPKEWLSFIFQFHKADTFRKLFPLIIIVGVYTAIIAYLELHYFTFDKDSALRNISVLHSLLGFALSMLLVFRTNTAYDRWWEGRRQWGSLNNSSRNLAIKLDGLLAKNDIANRAFFAAVIGNIAVSLKNHLRHKFIPEEWSNVEGYSIEQACASKNLPIASINILFKKLIDLKQQGILNDTHLLLLDNDLRVFSDTIGACERIKNTPIPFSYSVFLKKFIFLYVMTLPFGYAFTLNWYVVIVVMLIFYALASLELIAEEIENPFGTDPNDLPLNKLSDGIRSLTTQILQDEL